MAELNIVREHALGLPKARKIAFQWAEQVEQEFAMQCNYAQGKHEDEVDFVRSGVKGSLTVTKWGQATWDEPLRLTAGDTRRIALQRP